jgi:hypothetical protein
MNNYWLEKIKESARLKRYEKYELYFSRPKIKEKIKTVVHKVCEIKDGYLILIGAHNRETKQVAESCLTRINAHNKLGEWVENTLVYGDTFLRIAKGVNGVEKAEKLSNNLIKRKKSNFWGMDFYSMDSQITYPGKDIVHIMGFYNTGYQPYGMSIFEVDQRDWFLNRTIKNIRVCFAEILTQVCYRNSLHLYHNQGKVHSPFPAYKNRLKLIFRE